MADEKRSFSVRERYHSMRHAMSGLWDMLKTEHNAWVHASATVVVLLISTWLRLDPIRLALIVLAVVCVWVTEALNTGLEVLADMLSPEHTAAIKRAKDVAAASVLIASVGATIIGLAILGPALLDRLQSH